MPENRSKEVGPGDRVLVTGAAGGIGRHIVRALVDAGCDVRAADLLAIENAPAIDQIVDAQDVEWHTGNLLDMDLDQLVQGCDAVIHLAARVGLSEPYDAIVETNVDLVEMLHDAATQAGVRHFVHFGCGSVYRPARGVLDENSAIEPRGAYEESKTQSEAVLRRAEGTPWTVLRPALVYGPHCTSMSAHLVTLPPVLRNFMPYLPGFTGGARANWAHVEDVASAAMVVLGNPRAYGAVFNVADDTALAAGEVITAITEAYGMPIGPLVRFPNTAVLMAFSPVVDSEYVEATIRTVLRQIWKRLARRYEIEGSPLRPKVDKSALLYVADDTVLDAAALRELGWNADYASFVDGIPDVIRWYEDAGWVPRFETESEVAHREDSSYGFGITQTLEGSWFDPQTSTSHPLQLTVDAEFANIVKADFTGALDGVAWFSGLAEDVAIEGTIEVRPFAGRKIVYQFGFTSGDDAFRCFAEATLNPLRPFSSMSRLQGAITDQRGEVRGRVELAFNFAEQAVPILLSFRPLASS